MEPYNHLQQQAHKIPRRSLAETSPNDGRYASGGPVDRDLVDASLRLSDKTSPIRQDVAEGRKKVSRACDSCKTRKSRCSGTKPCTRCIDVGLECKYESIYRRGRQPSIVDTHPPPLPSPAADLTQPSTAPGDSLLPGRASSFNLSRTSLDREEPVYEDRYIGPTSGIAFLRRAQSRLTRDFVSTKRRSADSTTAKKTSIFSFGDESSSDGAEVPLVWPPYEESRRLLARYFELAMPTYRFLHQGTTEGWLEALYSEGKQSPRHLTDSQAAVVLMVLAGGSLYNTDGNQSEGNGEHNGVRASVSFFEEAQRRLSKETGPARLESVQARLAQCLYLLGASRINQGWYTFGTTVQLVLSLGIHRYRHFHASRGNSKLVEAECRKRAFWSAYTLDRYFSVMLGRPRMFRDEDIDQHLPDPLDDTQISDRSVGRMTMNKQCAMQAPICHARLAQIIGAICNDLYPTHPIDDEERVARAERRNEDLKAWKADLPAFLDPSQIDPIMLMPTFRRQSTVLSLGYAHAVILANRQFLLKDFAHLSTPRSHGSPKIDERVRECIDAALLVVDIVKVFVEQKTLFRHFWFTQYIAFCAIATLYVSSMQYRRDSNLGRVSFEIEGEEVQPKPHFRAAEKCQVALIESSGGSPSCKRYAIILDELKWEVLKRLASSSLHAPLDVASRFPESTRNFTMTRGSEIDQMNSRENHEIERATKKVNTQRSTEITSTADYGLFDINSVDMLDTAIPLNLYDDLAGWPELDSWATIWTDALEDFDDSPFASEM